MLRVHSVVTLVLVASAAVGNNLTGFGNQG